MAIEPSFDHAIFLGERQPAERGGKGGKGYWLQPPSRSSSMRLSMRRGGVRGVGSSWKRSSTPKPGSMVGGGGGGGAFEVWRSMAVVPPSSKA